MSYMGRPKIEAGRESEMLAALNAFVDARDPVRRGSLFQQIVGGVVERDDSLSDLIDTMFALDDPARATTKAAMSDYLKAHPGEWTSSRDDALRQAIAGDRSLRSIIHLW